MGSDFGSWFNDFGGGAVSGAVGGGMGQLAELLMMAPDLIGMINGDDEEGKKKKKRNDYYDGEPDEGWDNLDDGGLMSMMGQTQQQPSASGSGKPGIGQLAKSGMGIYKALQ